MTKEKLEEIKKDYPNLYELMTIEGQDITARDAIKSCIDLFLYDMKNRGFKYQIRESSPYIRIIAYSTTDKRYDFEFYYREYPSEEIMGVKFGKGDLVLNAKGNFSIRIPIVKNEDNSEEGKYIFKIQQGRFDKDLFNRFVKLRGALFPYMNITPEETLERTF